MLMMMTCFTRFIIVLAILRQALGLQQSPPNKILTGIALALTLLVMRPVWTTIYLGIGRRQRRLALARDAQQAAPRCTSSEAGSMPGAKA